MGAAVQEHGDVAGGRAHQDDGLPAERAGDEVADVGDLALVADEDPESETWMRSSSTRAA
jgi:hypothetical protein